MYLHFSCQITFMSILNAIIVERALLKNVVLFFNYNY